MVNHHDGSDYAQIRALVWCRGGHYQGVVGTRRAVRQAAKRIQTHGCEHLGGRCIHLPHKDTHADAR